MRVGLRHSGSRQRKPLAILPMVREAHSMGSEDAEMRAYCAQGREWDRLGDPNGVVEFERTKEILQRRLPAAPAVIADIGGGRGAMRCGSLSWVTPWCIEI